MNYAARAALPPESRAHLGFLLAVITVLMAVITKCGFPGDFRTFPPAGFGPAAPTAYDSPEAEIARRA